MEERVCGKVIGTVGKRGRPRGVVVRRREVLLALADPRRYSLCQVAYRVGVEPSYLSKVERGLEPAPGETTAVAVARELQLDPDLLLAMAGKVSSELQALIRKPPHLFPHLIPSLH